MNDGPVIGGRQGMHRDPDARPDLGVDLHPPGR